MDFVGVAGRLEVLGMAGESLIVIYDLKSTAGNRRDDADFVAVFERGL